MKEQELAGFRFFRVLLPGFSEKMLLPQDFIKQIRNEKITNTAIFLSPTGTVWQVNLHNETDGVYVGGRGWQDLTLANNLGNGYFLVFHYKGNMVFSFRAFDLSAREITYSVTQKDERKESMPNNFAPDNTREPTKSSHKKLKTEGLSHAHDKKGSEMHRHPTLEARFEVTIKECNLSRRRLCVLIPSGFTKSFGVLTKVSKLTLRDPKGVMWPIGLFYSMGSHDVYISKGWPAFARANEVKVGDRCVFELLLKCQNQVTMSVKILNNISVVRPMKTREVSTASMKDEVEILENPPVIRPMKPQEGSTTLMEDEVEILENMPVITPMKTRGVSTASMKDEVDILENPPILRPMKPQECCTTSKKGKNLSSGASFEATITDYSVCRNYMHIPHKFIESNGLGKCRELALKDMQGRTWVVSLCHSRHRGGRIVADTRMSKGWKKFASINRLGKGDKCVFELASRGKKSMVVLKVRILRSRKANE